MNSIQEETEVREDQSELESQRSRINHSVLKAGNKKQTESVYQDEVSSFQNYQSEYSNATEIRRIPSIQVDSISQNNYTELSHSDQQSNYTHTSIHNLALSQSNNFTNHRASVNSNLSSGTQVERIDVKSVKSTRNLNKKNIVCGSSGDLSEGVAD